MADFDIKDFLDKKVEQFNQPSFIAHDPICIPHLFTKKQDIEVMGFFAAILAWGQRKTIINKCKELITRFDGAPYDFMRNHQDSDLKQLLGFKHRTFNDTDLLFFVSFFRDHYHRFDSLEDAFLLGSQVETGRPFMENALNEFKAYFFSQPDYPIRTRKHISSPVQKSSCKRLNMYLRWMVRADDRGVDFGLWKRIRPADLVCPCDVHVERVARQFGLITADKLHWKTALELTDNLKAFDPLDPVKYDFALFGLGVVGEL
ncbi:TIGR02757 family protein [Sphingobacterium psychroaquaticum]|uniref:TIGR02757 family protein n=1 Tax=Sphingobacterium psychroaquaticum TaxID=561061 RepID=A0A1X7JP69_9SPHI|nr:TIGR02757 family protein [Sphingobacterium psychroaquaticum]QBQ40902.1 TIGR02757 family protein [Sphingobacterium psychroaquaticum]SMG29683.1 TIGR02757 family protein [Sphingobacterium psychroaquaticum]